MGSPKKKEVLSYPKEPLKRDEAVVSHLYRLLKEGQEGSGKLGGLAPVPF